jgi:hypothetical protein
VHLRRSFKQPEYASSLPGNDGSTGCLCLAFGNALAKNLLVLLVCFSLIHSFSQAVMLTPA